jgi:hypothetical protein
VERVLERLGGDGAVDEPAIDERPLDRGQQLRGPAAAGDRVDEQQMASVL